MPVVMKVNHVFDDRIAGAVGKYVVWFDPNKPTEPLGGFSPHLAKAKRFKDHLEAMEFWRQQRTIDGGLRKDGEPDRPLTAFGVELISVTM
jgi:hypothetical protein